MPRSRPGGLALHRAMCRGSCDGWYAADLRTSHRLGYSLGSDRVPFATVQRVEFTVEPFVEGNPGRHVTEPLAALQALGIDVEFGPFGSGCTTSTEAAG